MKATEIVRRIDDLGRIVIPKEIRRVLRIRESDPLLITLSDIKKPRNYAGLEYVRQDMFLTGIIGVANRLAVFDKKSEEEDIFVVQRNPKHSAIKLHIYVSSVKEPILFVTKNSLC